MHGYPTVFIAGDPTDHGSNVGAVALFALAIFVLIGLIVFFITRRGRRPLRPTAGPRSRPNPRPTPPPDPDAPPKPAPRQDAQREERGSARPT